jgi:hypothetical protein
MTRGISVCCRLLLQLLAQARCTFAYDAAAGVAGPFCLTGELHSRA